MHVHVLAALPPGTDHLASILREGKMHHSMLRVGEEEDTSQHLE
jgi:hypothetical protein